MVRINLKQPKFIGYRIRKPYSNDTGYLVWLDYSTQHGQKVKEWVDLADSIVSRQQKVLKILKKYTKSEERQLIEMPDDSESYSTRSQRNEAEQDRFDYLTGGKPT